MTTKDKFRIPPEVRDKGLEILYSDLPDMEKCRLLEELLRPADRDPNFGYSWTSMASDLGVPFRKFHYQLLKSYFRGWGPAPKAFRASNQGFGWRGDN